MSRLALRTAVAIAALLSAGAAGAHHPPRMDHCVSLTFMGEIERIEWRNPHVVLTIRADSGESHRVTWLNLQALSRAGVDKDTLRSADRVTVTVGTRDDVVEKPMLLAAITKTSNGWEWSQVPQGC